MRFARIGAAALLAWMGAGCASLPAPLAPAARPPYSALELQRRIEASDVAHLAFADDAIPRTTAGEEVRGRAAIQDHLLSDGTSRNLILEVFPGRVWRCGPESGRRRARARRPVEGGAHGGGGPKRARGPSPKPPVTLGLQGPPFGFFLADPHAELRDAGGLPFRSRDVTRPGGAISASYRFTDWLTVGGVWTLDPTIQTDYGTAIEPRRWVDSGAPSFALLSGYVGRNVSIMAGPVRVWSQWTWDHVHSTEADRTEYVRMGAMVRASALVPLRSDLNIEFVVRRLLVGRDVVPATDPVRHGAVGGFFIGAGIAVRRTPR